MFCWAHRSAADCLRASESRWTSVTAAKPERPTAASLSHQVGPELWGKGHANYLASRADIWCDEPLSVRVQWKKEATATGVLTRKDRLSDGPNVSFHISVVS